MGLGSALVGVMLLSVEDEVRCCGVGWEGGWEVGGFAHVW